MTEAAELTVPPHAGKTPMNMLEVSRHAGGVAYANMADTIATAELMSRSGIAVRSHLRGEPGACHAVVMLAIAWDMNPYLVANKSYSVNNQLAFEAQLIQSVIQVRAPIKGRIKTEYKGEGGKRQLRVWAETRPAEGEASETVDYTSPEFEKIQPKNSPLWKNDPDQQLHYYSVRAWCRRHFPEILLGVYAPDEVPPVDLQPGEYREVQSDGMNAKLDRIAAPKKERATRAAAPPAQPDHDPETGEILKESSAEPTKSKDEPVKAPGPVKAAEPDPVKEPVKVTSGKPAPDPEADRRATEQEKAAAAGALDPDDDPFREDVVEEEKPHPVRVAVGEFGRRAATAKTEEEFEGLRKDLMKAVKGLPATDPEYVNAATAYKTHLNSFRERIAKVEEASKTSTSAGEQSDQSGMSADEEDELERLLVHELDHSPRGIDTGSLAQVKAYLKGMEAAAKGRAAGAVPAIYSSEESEAWKAGHAYRTANAKSEG
ncbi:recombinase RecT [Bosea sp. (in: a-proteobacteria)]|uniref:recombinase RecT n=1 Tax=Bosea sp. (in: a-proteobacteria) TaxID=1871050 RepID=UPI001AD2C40E|nr:recombinase RecT [Bosea sp. (in: a-proteobacteria)]MBN9441139.1 recombinase RecT [Bosea sp. (in: a-proteobacteria)]